MCKCRQNIEVRLLDRLKEQKPGVKDHGAKLMGYAMGIVGSTMVSKPYMGLEISYQSELKKRPGEYRSKKEKLNMYFNFCPFCGVNLQDKEDQTNREGNEK